LSQIKQLRSDYHYQPHYTTFCPKTSYARQLFATLTMTLSLNYVVTLMSTKSRACLFTLPFQVFVNHHLMFWLR